MKPKKSKPKRKYKYRPRLTGLMRAHYNLPWGGGWEDWACFREWGIWDFKNLNYVLHRFAVILNHDQE